MAKKTSSFLSNVGIIAGTAVLSVVATRLFDRYLADKVGLGDGGKKKALPVGDDAQEGEPGPQTAHNPHYPHNPYGFGGLMPLPPPIVVPVPSAPAWGPPPWAQQQPPPPVQQPNPPKLEVVEEEEDEEETNVSAFLEGLEG